jgi:N-acetylmuramoyl-L-alanine amidase
MAGNGLTAKMIVDVQRRLKILGYNLGKSEIDGIMGPETRNAVRKFQQDRGLLVTGNIDEDTWQEFVDAGYNIGDRLLYLKNPPFRGDDVKTLQLWLKTLGFYKSNENGIFCGKTQKALMEFQKNMKIYSDGILGAETLQHLKNLRRMIESKASSNYPFIRNYSGRKIGESIKVIFDYGENISEVAESLHYFKEKIYICKSIALFSRDMLLQMGIDSELTVNDNYNLSLFLNDRIKFANRSNSDVLISINLGFSGDPDANGSSCYYFKGARSHSITGENIANLIQDRLVDNLNVTDCRVHGANYAVLKQTVMTAVLVEPGFISNKNDHEKIKKTEYQMGVVNAIIEGITAFIND